MKIIFLTSLLLVSNIAFGEIPRFDSDQFKFKDLGYITNKQKILKITNLVKIITPPNDECSYFSAGNPYGPYQQFIFPNFSYIGGKNQRFLLEYITFDSKGKVIAYYDDKKLSGLTTKDDFFKIIGSNAKEYYKDSKITNTIVLYSKGSDDGVKFEFKHKKLVAIRYWHSC